MCIHLIYSVTHQHAAPQLDFDWWATTFQSSIASFGRTVMVLAPWHDPIPLQRGWCVWELYCTIIGKRSGQCIFEVALSPESEQQFIEDVNQDRSNRSEQLQSDDFLQFKIVEIINRSLIVRKQYVSVCKTRRLGELIKISCRYLNSPFLSREPLRNIGPVDVNTLWTMYTLARLYESKGVGV